MGELCFYGDLFLLTVRLDELVRNNDIKYREKLDCILPSADRLKPAASPR